MCLLFSKSLPQVALGPFKGGKIIIFYISIHGSAYKRILAYVRLPEMKINPFRRQNIKILFCSIILGWRCAYSNVNEINFLCVFHVPLDQFPLIYLSSSYSFFFLALILLLLILISIAFIIIYQSLLFSTAHTVGTLRSKSLRKLISALSKRVKK